MRNHALTDAENHPICRDNYTEMCYREQDKTDYLKRYCYIADMH